MLIRRKRAHPPMTFTAKKLKKGFSELLIYTPINYEDLIKANKLTKSAKVAYRLMIFNHAYEYTPYTLRHLHADTLAKKYYMCSYIQTSEVPVIKSILRIVTGSI
jgi:hypothetical protein